MRNIKVLVLSMFTVVFAIACSQAANTNQDHSMHSNGNRIENTSTSETPVASVKKDDIASGKEIYSKNCMICHKSTGVGGSMTIEGKTIVPDDLTAQKIKNLSDDRIVKYVTDGVVDEGMPAFKDKLSEAEIKAVVGYVRELQSK